MTMIAGGDDGMKAGMRVVRRPTIRPRPITPARAASTLPPARLPTPRAPRRPVLLIVDEDESEALSLPATAQPAGRASFWSRRRIVAVTGALVVLVAVAAMVGAQLASLRAMPVAVSTTETTGVAIVTRTTPAPTVRTPAARPEEPAVPVFDVNSLPAAPRSPARASR